MLVVLSDAYLCELATSENKSCGNFGIKKGQWEVVFGKEFTQFRKGLKYIRCKGYMLKNFESFISGDSGNSLSQKMKFWVT